MHLKQIITQDKTQFKGSVVIVAAILDSIVLGHGPRQRPGLGSRFASPPSLVQGGSSSPISQQRPFSSCCLGTMILLLGNPQAQPSSSRPWDHRRALDIAATPSDYSEKTSRHRRVRILGRPGSWPFPLHTVLAAWEGMCGANLEGVNQTWWAGGRTGLTAAFPGWQGPLIGAERSLILPATTEGGCGWQVKSCQGKYRQEGEPHARETTKSATPLL